MARFLIKKSDGYVYPYTDALAKRDDMRLFNGTLAGAKKEALNMPSEEEEAGPEETPKAPAPDPSPDTRMELIKAAIAKLDPDNPEHYTDGGVPRVAAIEQDIGDDITAEERNKALEEME